MKTFFGSRHPARNRKCVLWFLGLLAGYAVLGFLILPPIIRAIAVKQLSRQLDRKVTIQKVKLNPFTLSATVDGLLIKDKDGQPFISWDEVYVNFQLSSFFGKPWVFDEVSLIKPFVRVQMDKDYKFNFSDLITKFSARKPETTPKAPSQPLALNIRRLQIINASASLTDLTPRTPFRRIIGPLNVKLENFRTNPDNKNPYSFAGTTDAGETLSWNGFFYLDPLRSQGELTLNNITLNKYAPLYQDLVRFVIRDGSIGIHANYRFELSTTNRVMAVTNVAFALRHFKLGVTGDSNNIIAISHFAVTGASLNLESRRAEIGNLLASGGKLFLERNRSRDINVVQLSQPAESLTNAPGGILFLLRSVTNTVALLLNSTNQWRATIHNVNITNCALHLEDFVNSRPARLELDDIALTAKNISNLPNTNLTAELSLRWNTNGTINTKVAASFLPPTADVHLAFTNLNLDSLDPYLEPKVNLLILNSKLGLNGEIRLRTPDNTLPEVTFQGGARLDDLHIVDGVLGEDLLKWKSFRVSGIDASLNPPSVAIKQIAVDDAYARVIVETNHTINLFTALRPAETNAATNPPTLAKNSAPTNGASSQTPQISIGRIVISNATVNFTDRSITPNVNFAVQQAGGEVAGISSAELQHANVNLRAVVDGVGPATITGQINPFSGTLTNNLKILVKDVDLTPASPYSGKFAGYRIARGKLNLDLAYNLIGRKLKSKNVITLDQFTFGQKVNSPNATKLPVRLAVAILKDREGKIVLDVPVEGSLDDPKFRISKVVTRAIVNLLTKVATSPFSLIGTVFGGGGEELSYEDFAPGSAELLPIDRQKLDSLAQALYNHPALQLEISGSVDPLNDRAGLQQVALEKELRTQKWQSLRKSEQATTTADQIVLTPEERVRLIKKLYREAVANGVITPAFIAAHTNLAVAAAEIPSPATKIEKGATELMRNTPDVSQNAPVPAKPTPSPIAVPANPMEALLLATMPIADSDLETLAEDRAKAVRAYIVQTGKVEASRLFLTESQTGSVRSDGSRVYLQFQ